MNTLPKLTYQQRIDRRDAKHSLILQFLSDFEVFTSVAVAAQLLSTSESSARRALMQLVMAKLVSEEKHFVDGRQLSIFGITQSGLMAADAPTKSPYFERGRVSSSYINHKLSGQMIRIICERMGGSWKSERLIRIQNPSFRKIPDALCTIDINTPSLPSSRLLVEIERHPKTAKRYAEIMSLHLSSLETDEYGDAVLYLFPRRYFRSAVNLLRSVILCDPPSRDNLLEKREHRFMVGVLEEFPDSVQLLSGKCVDFVPSELQ